MSKLSKARIKANKKWDQKNKDKRKVYLYRSHAKTFIRDIANKKDLQDLRKLIDKKLG